MTLTLTVLVMVKIDSGLEMSLAKQYFDDLLVSIKRQDHSFSRTAKKSIYSIHVQGFLITRGSNLFSIRSDRYILAGNILLSTPAWKLFWKTTFNLGLVKLTHY